MEMKSVCCECVSAVIIYAAMSIYPKYDFELPTLARVLCLIVISYGLTRHPRIICLASDLYYGLISIFHPYMYGEHQNYIMIRVIIVVLFFFKLIYDNEL